jgi:hypothetical protein
MFFTLGKAPYLYGEESSLSNSTCLGAIIVVRAPETAVQGTGNGRSPTVARSALGGL